MPYVDHVAGLGVDLISAVGEQDVERNRRGAARGRYQSHVLAEGAKSGILPAGRVGGFLGREATTRCGHG